MMFVLADDGHGRHLRLWRISLHDDLYDDCNGKMAKQDSRLDRGIFVRLKIYEKSGEKMIDHRFNSPAPRLRLSAACVGELSGSQREYVDLCAGLVLCANDWNSSAPKESLKLRHATSLS